MTNLHFFILLGLASFVLADPIDVIKSGLLDTLFFRRYDRDGTKQDELLKNVVNLYPKIDKRENVTLYIPGYLDSLDTSFTVPLVKDAYFQATNNTFMALDYRLIEYNLYTVGVDMTVDIGKAVAKAIDTLVNAGIPIEKWHVVGFSLGAQIAGAVGGNMNNTLPRITGLDPAGPLFTFIQRHLMSTDATFVDVIHTDMGAYGTILQLGHADFYPNFGKKPQPSCPALDPPFFPGDICSHFAAVIYYEESVKNPSIFIGRNCNSDTDFISGKCNSNGTALMGYGTPTNARGKYYLTTSAVYPYGRGIDGASYP